MDCKFYLCLLLILCGTITVLGALPGHHQEEVKRQMVGGCGSMEGTFCSVDCAFMMGYGPCEIDYPGCYGGAGCCCPHEYGY